MAIIYNFSSNGTISFEHAVELIAAHLRTERHMIIRTELGTVLIENSRTYSKTPLKMCHWGMEPDTEITIRERHQKIDYYARINLPATQIKLIERTRTLGVMIMGYMFISALCPGRAYWDPSDYLDAVVMAWSDSATSCRDNPTISSIVEMENLRSITSIIKSERKLAWNLINEIAGRRTEQARKLVEDGNCLLPKCNDTFPMSELLNGFWNKMLLLGAVAHKEESITSRTIKVSPDGVNAYFKKNPDHHMSQCDAVIKMICTNMFDKPAETTEGKSPSFLAYFPRTREIGTEYDPGLLKFVMLKVKEAAEELDDFDETAYAADFKAIVEEIASELKGMGYDPDSFGPETDLIKVGEVYPEDGTDDDDDD